MRSVLAEQLQQRFDGSPLLTLFDEEVADTLELTDIELTVLAGALLTSGGSVAEIAAATGLKPKVVALAVDDLLKREFFYFIDSTHLDLTPLGAKVALLKEAEDNEEYEYVKPPSSKLVLRPMRETVLALIHSHQSETIAIARVYALLYGGKIDKTDWGKLGKIVTAIGRDRAALLLLENCSEVFDDPIDTLLTYAQARAKEWRPEGVLTLDEEKEANKQIANLALQSRMRVWKRKGETLSEVVKRIDADQRAGLMTKEQANADKRQARADFAVG